MRIKPFVNVRIRWLALCVSLVCLTVACALLSDTDQPSPATATAPPPSLSPTPLPTARPTAAATAAPTAPASSAGTPATTTTAAPGAVESVRLILVPGDNEVRYRVREQLAILSFPSDAIGATRAVTGAIVARADGTVVSHESKVRVDLRTLKSDRDQRDTFLKGNTLQTNRYPFAEFVPTAIQGLTLPPPKSGPVEFKLIGELTIRNVTKPVTWDVKGRVEGDEAFGLATASFTFDYFNLTKPRVATVLSVEDTIKLEIDLHLRRVAEQ